MKKYFLLITFTLAALSSIGQIQNLNTGTVANDHTGDTRRAAWIKAQANFVYLDDNKIDKTLTRNRVTTDYTLALTDNFKMVEMNSASAHVITVPPNASVAFTADDTQITVVRYGAGTLTIVAGVGVTIRSADGALGLRAQYSAATLIKIGTNEWYLIGDIE